MGQPSWRNLLMALGLVLMLVGATLRIKGYPSAWYVMGVSVAVYLYARFFHAKRNP